MGHVDSMEYQNLGGGEMGLQISKARHARMTDRELRRISTLKFWGRDGMLLWFITSTYQTFIIYSCLCAGVFYLQFRGVSIQVDWLGLDPGYRPFLMGALQFLAAFLVGVGLTDAVTRYKSAMTALTDLIESVENLRMLLLSSTVDPKFRVAVQVYITWFIVLLRKKITFFTEDFSQPLHKLIHPRFSNSVLFKPEVLWTLERSQAEFLFNGFLTNAKLLDNNGMVKNALAEMTRSWRSIATLLMVRSPTTRHVLGRATVEMFLASIPIFNEDCVTLVMLPLVACVLVAIIHLSEEICEPWGDDYHDLPTDEVMYFLSVPSWFGDDQEKAEEAVAWLNKGMTDNVWTWTKDSPIPREKRKGASKGDLINFDDYHTLHEIVGHATFADFVKHKKEDMDEAEQRGRRMPKYLKTAVRPAVPSD